MPGARWLEDPRLHRLLPWLCGLIAAGIAAKNLIGGYGDLGIYLDVAREFRQGGIDIFRDRANAGPWVYPHFAALPFVALQLVCSDAAIRWLWCLGLGLGTSLLLIDLARAMRPFGGLLWWQWLAFGVLFQRCLAQNMTHGQLSLWVGTLVLHGIVHLQNGRAARAGIWLGLAAALKLTPLLFLVALPLQRAPRAAAAMFATMVVAVLVVPWPFCGTAEHSRHLADFWRTIGEALAGDSGSAILGSGPSVSGTLDYLLQARPLDAQGHTVNVLDLGDGALRVVKLAWSGLLGGLLLLWFLRARAAADPQRLGMQAAAVTLAMSLFAPLLRVYHLAAALLPCALFCRGPRHRADWLWWATAIAILFAMTLRQKNLLGETLWSTLDSGGLLHFGLVAMLVWLVRDSAAPRQPCTSPEATFAAGPPPTAGR